MTQASAIHALEKAKNIADYAMVPIGGAGPVHACNIALKLAMPRVICPRNAGVASALGFLVSPTAFTFVRGGVMLLDDLQFDHARGILDQMEQEGETLLDKSGTPRDAVRVDYFAAMRYVGQGYHVETPISPAILENKDRRGLRAAFEANYKARFGRIEPAMQVEIVSWKVTVTGPKPEMAAVGPTATSPLSVGGRAGRRGASTRPVPGWVRPGGGGAERCGERW